MSEGDEEVTRFVACADESSSSVEDEVDDLEAASRAYSNSTFRRVNGEPHAGPIQYVVTANANDGGAERNWHRDRYYGRKPVYVWANIHKNHLNTGEPTSKCPGLKDVIRSRGKTSGRFRDDCGHVISRKLGGHMVDYNLFPQSPPLNSGWMGNSVLWTAIEFAASTWLSVIPAAWKPRVEFAMLLQYDEAAFPDRPNKFKYVIRFFITRRRREDSSSEEEEQKYVFTKKVVNIAKELIKSARTDFNLRRQIVEIIRSHKLNQADLIDFLKMLKKVEDFLESIKIPAPPSITLHSVGRNPIISRNISLIDFLPVIGAAKGIAAGTEDLLEGHIMSGVGNIALNGAFLALDVCTIGAVSSIAKGGFKAIGKIAAKEVAKEAAERTFVIGWQTLVTAALGTSYTRSVLSNWLRP